MTASGEPLVFLVGAGPGDPGLMTLRGVECLRLADVIIHDKLVPVRLLDLAPAGAERIPVTGFRVDPDRPSHAHQTQITGCMIDNARAGKRVVRLKGGDPFVFGRGGEEAEALREAGIPYEVVPGVTAGLGASAYAEIPVTHRQHASACALVTGHENPTKNDGLDWSSLARFPGTLVIYMGFAKLGLIVKRLLDEGKPPDTPAALVQEATTGFQKTVTAPLAELPDVVNREGLTAPAIIFVGGVVAHRPERSWFEARPLYGKRVLVTRPRHQAGDMVRRLELLGAVPFVLPTLDIAEPDDWGPADAAVDRLAEFDWVVFTSANGVRGLLDRLPSRGKDVRALGRSRIAAIGPSTAAALAEYRLTADLVPAVYTSEGLVAELARLAAGGRVLLARANRGRDELRAGLAGVAAVEQVAVYKQTDAVAQNGAVVDSLRRGEIGYVTLTSSNVARALLRSLDDFTRERFTRGDVRLVSISPVTSGDVRAEGFEVAAEAAEATAEGVVQALVRLVRSEA